MKNVKIIDFQGRLGPVDRMKFEIQEFFDGEFSSIIGSSNKCVQLIQGQILGETKHSVVWKGKYEYKHLNIPQCE